VHVTLALLVTQSFVAMIAGGPVLEAKLVDCQTAMPATETKQSSDAVIP
jgi:hypothetical protein